MEKFCSFDTFFGIQFLCYLLDDNGVAIPVTQERVRHVLRWPESGRHPCPTMLKEVRACPSRCSGGENCLFPCHTYSWAVQDWGSCVLPDNTDCGAGFRTRGKLLPFTYALK